MSSLTASSPEDFEAAYSMTNLSNVSAVSNSGSKREREAIEHNASSTKPNAKKAALSKSKDESDQDMAADEELPPMPYPFYFYTDRSREKDSDPTTPVTQTGRISFLMKIHAILSKPELVNIIAWDDHGRSFRILKPSMFKATVLDRYFGNCKFASFTRQLNAWGFRSLREGENRGSYYEENFIRGMPWLCKNMERHEMAKKKAIARKHQPDLVAISKQLPIPEYPMTLELQVVSETIETGPKANMPENWFLLETKREDSTQKSTQTQPSLSVVDAPDPTRADIHLNQGVAGAQPLLPNQDAGLNISLQDAVLNSSIRSNNQSGQVPRQSSFAGTNNINIGAADPSPIALLQHAVAMNRLRQTMQNSHAGLRQVNNTLQRNDAAAQLSNALTVAAALEHLTRGLQLRSNAMPNIGTNFLAIAHDAAPVAARPGHAIALNPAILNNRQPNNQFNRHDVAAMPNANPYNFVVLRTQQLNK